MAGVIDTNILLYAANKDAEEHRSAVTFLEAVGSGADQWYLTEGILYEFLRVTTHPKVFDRPLSWRQAVQFLDALVQNPNIQILRADEKHWEVLQEILPEINHPAGNLFFDIRTLALMREHGVREIYSADTDFLQFSGIRVINPLKHSLD
jgi:toxin-antitoxin system PIN domain toxin